MCLNLISEKKTAKKPIVCYKRLSQIGGGMAHAHMQSGYLYEEGKEQPYVHPQTFGDEAYNGYHSWRSFFSDGNQVFIIPKDAEYYEGSQYNGQKGYVSSSIVWVGSKYSLKTWRKVSDYKNKNK